MSGKITTLIAVFALVMQPMYGIIAGNNTNALGALANELKASPLTAATEVQTGTVEVSAKAIRSGFLGWTNAQSLANTTSVTASVDPGQGLLASSCTADDWASSITKNIQLGRDIEGRFCFKSNSIGDHTINFSTTIARISDGSPKILNTSAVVSVQDTTPPETTLTTPIGLAGNEFTISGVASDNMALNRVFVQLVHRETGECYGESTINLIPQGAGPYAWSQSYNATSLNLPEGTYAAHVQAVDMSNNRTDVGWSDNFTLDKTAPSFEILSPINGITVRGQEEVSVRITDSNNIKKVLLNVGDGHGNYSWEDGKTNSKIQRSGNVFTLDFDTKKLNDGENFIVVRATDGAGNTRCYNNNRGVSQHSYFVDNTAPTVQVTGVTPTHNGNIGGSNVKVSFRVNDASEINLDRTYVMFADGPGTTKQHKESSKIYLRDLAEPVDGVYTATFDTKKFVAENYTGRYNLQFTLVDVHGNNTSTKPIEYRNILIDNNGPSITNKNPANGQIIRGVHTVSVEVTDANGVNPDSVYARFKNSAGREFTYYLQREGETNIYSLEVDTTQFVPQGESLTLDRVSFRAVDSVGNPRSSISSNVTIDNQRPTIEIISPAGDNAFNPLQATITATDIVGLARLDVTYWNADNTEPIRNSAGNVRGWGAVVPTKHKTDWTTSFNLPTDLEDGTYTIRATATDLADNSMNAENATFTVDSKSPVVEFLNLGNGLTYRGAVNIEASVLDLNLSHYYLSIWLNDDRYNTTDAWNTVYTSGFDSRTLATLTADGNYRVLLEARDKAGKKDENSVKEITFTIDNSPELNARYFVAHESHMGVGFSVDYLSDDATSVTVELLDGETVVATNIGDTDAMRELLNKNPEEISSPFFLDEEGWSDKYWRLASPVDWATVSRLTKARITLNYGEGGSKTDYVDLTDTGLGHSFEALQAQFIQDRADRLAAEEAERVAEEARRRAQERQDELDRIAREQAERERLAREAAAAQAERDRLEAEAAAAGRGALPITPLATVFPAGDTVIDDATVETEADTDEEGEVAAAVTDGDENGEVKAAEDVKDSWSLINLLLTIAVAAASIFALIGLAGKKEDRNIGARLLTVVPALGAGAVLLFAEDFSGQMSWVNIWTLLVGALLIAQMILLANTKTETE